jgi:hypothetical protein
MAYTALQLITRSYYLSQVVSRELQTVSGDQITDGLYLLNALLDFKGSDLRLIPYFQRYNFSAVVGQEEYFIPNLLYVDTLTFNIGDVRYSMIEKTRSQYFGSPRVDNIEALPFTYRVERELGGSRIYLYFLPESTYTMKLSGKFGFTEVALQTDLSTAYDLYYIEYLRYALARYICAEYGATFPDASERQFQEIQKKLMDVSPADLSIRKKSFFGNQLGYDWQHINISPAWIP